jgi:toxin ParE1/3/4
LKIGFARSAQISLHNAINFIRQDNPPAANKFLTRVEDTFQRLKKFPDSGRMIPEFPELPYRELLVAPYRFFYRVEGKTIYVVAVWHTSQLPKEPEK